MSTVPLRTILHARPELETLPIEIPMHLRAEVGLGVLKLAADGGPAVGQRVIVAREHWCQSPPCGGRVFEIVKSERPRGGGEYFTTLRDVGTGALHRTLHN